MDLEKLNTSYEKAKKTLDDKKKKIEVLEKDIKTAVDDIEIAKAAKIVAQRNNDAADIKRADDTIKARKEDIERLKKLIEEEKDEMQMFQDKVDKIIEDIKENPEMKQHLEQVLAKRYSREIKKIEPEKEKEEKKLASLETVQKMVDEHPTMKNHMQGMLNANAAINKLNEELSKLDAIKDKDRIDDIKDEIIQQTQKLEKNRDGILDFAEKNKMNITRETLEDIMKNDVVNKKTNQVNLQETLNKNIRNSKKQIRGYKKQISNNEKAIIKLGYRVPEKTENKQTTGKGDNEQTTGKGDNQPSTENKLKWWQFRKRFNRWRENKKMQSLPNPEEKVSKDEKSEFASSLKYKVVQDIAEQMKQENLKEVKKETKSNGKEVEK